MPNITKNHAIYCLYDCPLKVCNFYINVFQIKLKYHALSKSNRRNFSCTSINELTVWSSSQSLRKRTGTSTKPPS